MSGERILVVDDGADMRDFVINYVLRPMGFTYFEARDGMEALDVISMQQPDLILTDLQMPRLDGLGLLRRMKERGIKIPVILMTFYGSEDIAIEVFRLGVRDYVIKPFTEEELLTAIDRGLLEARLRHQRDVLRRVGTLVASLPDNNTLMKGIVQAAVDLTSSPEVSLIMISDDGRSLMNRADHSRGTVRVLNQQVQNPLAWQAIQSAQIVSGQERVDNVTIRTLIPICVPLIVAQTVFGALSITLPAEMVTEELSNLLDSLSDYAAIGLERARLATLVS
jgi:DNA-binding response OmpR family regulator